MMGYVPWPRGAETKAYRVSGDNKELLNPVNCHLRHPTCDIVSAWRLLPSNVGRQELLECTQDSARHRLGL
jgi:hypothetical protein